MTSSPWIRMAMIAYRYNIQPRGYSVDELAGKIKAANPGDESQREVAAILAEVGKDYDSISNAPAKPSKPASSKSFESLIDDKVLGLLAKFNFGLKTNEICDALDITHRDALRSTRRLVASGRIKSVCSCKDYRRWGIRRPSP